MTPDDAVLDQGARAERAVTAEDVRLSFELFHGREADAAVVRDRTGQPLRLILAGALGSAEFQAAVMAPVAQGRPPDVPIGLVGGGVGGREGRARLAADLGVEPGALDRTHDPADVLRAMLQAPLIAGVLEGCYDAARLSAFRDGLARLGAALDEARRLHREAGERLRAACRALTVEAWQAVSPQGEALRLTGEDPWVMARLAAEVAQAPLVRLTLTAWRTDGEALRPRVYLDYGGGVSEAHALAPHADGADGFALLIAGPAEVERLRIDFDDREGVMRLGALAAEAVAPEGLAAQVQAAAVDPADAPYAVRLAERLAAEVGGLTRGDAAGAFGLSRRLNDGCFPASPDYAGYPAWIARYATPGEADYRRMAEIAAGFAIRPRFSFVMPTYNTPIELLRRCVNSMLAQTYREFEICIADDHSPDPQVAAYLEGLAATLPQVKFVRRRRNGHISEASNTALSLATGDFVVLVDHDDEIPDFALFTVAAFINARPDAAILFSDEDKIDVEGRRSDPYFKSEYNSFLMYGHNMVSHLGVYRRSLVEEVGGFRKGLEGSQDYDLFFRCYERIAPEQVVHIPHVLYHWRMIPGSTAVSADQKGYAIVAAQAAINGHFERTGLPLRSIPGRAPGVTDITPTRFVDTPVSIIIPTRDGLDVLKPCIDSVLATTDRETVEIIVADNGSVEPETLAYLAALERDGLARVLPLPGEFNFSAINNEAARHAKGDILCFLNNDTEVIAPTWLERARALLSIPEVGVVGARLLFPDGTLQHMGIVLGMGDHGVAGTPHGGREEEDPGYLGKAWLTAEFSAVTAACMFIRRVDFEVAGRFNPDLAVAYNDVDLCLRVRRMGSKVVCDGLALLTHKESRTRGPDKSGARAERHRRETEAVRCIWPSALKYDPLYSPNLTLENALFQLAMPPRDGAPWAL